MKNNNNNVFDGYIKRMEFSRLINNNDSCIPFLINNLVRGHKLNLRTLLCIFNFLYASVSTEDLLLLNVTFCPILQQQNNQTVHFYENQSKAQTKIVK